MEKRQALAHFQDSVKVAAAEIGVTQEAIRMWPDPLPPRIRDRVQAALWRRAQARSGELDGQEGGEAVHAATVGSAAADRVASQTAEELV